MPDQLIILLLHHIGTPPPGVTRRKLYLTNKHLNAHIRSLKNRGYEFTTLSRAPNCTGLTACLTFDDGFRDILDAQLDIPATVFAVTSLVGQKNVVFEGDTGVAPSDLASWEDLKALRDRGWEIGSHAHHHIRLTTTNALEELQASAHEIEKNLGARPTSLAWPYGAHDQTCIDAAKAAGFTCAAITKSGRASFDHPFQLKRVILSSFGALNTFERIKLAGVHQGWYPL